LRRRCLNKTQALARLAEHARNLQALEQAAGGPGEAGQLLEMAEAQRLQARAAELFSRVIDTTSLEDLRAVVAWLEDFELDTPPLD
jgi:hypothetical protein